MATLKDVKVYIQASWEIINVINIINLFLTSIGLNNKRKETLFVGKLKLVTNRFIYRYCDRRAQNLENPGKLYL